MPADTIVSRLLQKSSSLANQPALVRKVNGSWASLTFQEYGDQVKRAARGFMALGFAPQQVVTILANNRVEWVVGDVAAMAAAGVATGIYQTSTPEQVAFIVRHSESPICIVEDTKQLKKLQETKDSLPNLRWAILMEGAVPEGTSQWVMTWKDLLAKADATPEGELNARLESLDPKALATLIYTSGTTGDPKGVMLSHHNLTWTADSLLQTLPIPQGTPLRGMSYLPLSHIAEQMLSVHIPISKGGTVWFAESLEKLKENLPDCRPTLFFGVPRVYEKFQSALTARFAEATGVKASLLGFSRETATEYRKAIEEGRSTGGLLGLKYAAANKLVLGKLKGALGLDQCLQLVSGAAPIARDTLEFFRSIDLPVHEVYGQSEGSGPTTLNTLDAHKLGTVGRVIPGVTVKIAEDGEILVGGGNVFMGYYKNPEATAETLKDGLLCSGDVGEVDAKGFLRITDRKKELLKTSGGKYISPVSIEKELKAIPEVAQACVIGDNRKFCTALITLDPASAKSWATANGAASGEVTDLCRDPKFIQYFQGEIDKLNSHLAQYETIKKFTILNRDFTQEANELTPTMKMKRKFIVANHKDAIEAMYL